MYVQTPSVCDPADHRLVLMGYGFCIPNNPCDQVAIRLAYPYEQTHAELKRCIPTHFKSESWSDQESVFYIRGSNHYSGGYTNSWNKKFLRGLPQEFVLALRIIIEPSWESQQEDLDNERAIEAELWFDIFEIVLDRLREKQRAVSDVNKDLPVSPQNERQRQAKAYRDGQLDILQEVIREIETWYLPIGKTVPAMKALAFLLDPVTSNAR
jgi:hypothetical protein